MSTYNALRWHLKAFLEVDSIRKQRDEAERNCHLYDTKIVIIYYRAAWIDIVRSPEAILSDALMLSRIEQSCNSLTTPSHASLSLEFFIYIQRVTWTNVDHHCRKQHLRVMIKLLGMAWETEVTSILSFTKLQWHKIHSRRRKQRDARGKSFNAIYRCKSK